MLWGNTNKILSQLVSHKGYDYRRSFFWFSKLLNFLGIGVDDDQLPEQVLIRPHLRFLDDMIWIFSNWKCISKLLIHKTLHNLSLFFLLNWPKGWYDFLFAHQTAPLKYTVPPNITLRKNVNPPPVSGKYRPHIKPLPPSVGRLISSKSFQDQKFCSNTKKCKILVPISMYSRVMSAQSAGEISDSAKSLAKKVQDLRPNIKAPPKYQVPWVFWKFDPNTKPGVRGFIIFLGWGGVDCLSPITNGRTDLDSLGPRWRGSDSGRLRVTQADSGPLTLTHINSRVSGIRHHILANHISPYLVTCEDTMSVTFRQVRNFFPPWTRFFIRVFSRVLTKQSLAGRRSVSKHWGAQYSSDLFVCKFTKKKEAARVCIHLGKYIAWSPDISYSVVTVPIPRFCFFFSPHCVLYPMSAKFSKPDNARVDWFPDQGLFWGGKGHPTSQASNESTVSQPQLAPLLSYSTINFNDGSTQWGGDGMRISHLLIHNSFFCHLRIARPFLRIARRSGGGRRISHWSVTYFLAAWELRAPLSCINRIPVRDLSVEMEAEAEAPVPRALHLDDDERWAAGHRSSSDFQFGSYSTLLSLCSAVISWSLFDPNKASKIKYWLLIANQ